MAFDKESEEFVKKIIVILLFCFVVGCNSNNDCPKTDFWEQYAKTELRNYELCFQSKSYQYLKHHREMIKNLISEEKYDKKGSFPYETDGGTKILVHYTIGGYEFQEDGTLFGAIGRNL